MEPTVAHHKKQLGISYGEKKYWEEKYVIGTTFEWYLGYRHLKHIFRDIMKKINPESLLVSNFTFKLTIFLISLY